MFNKFFSPKIQPVSVPPKGWRKGMWVVYEGKPAILTELDPGEIHLVNPENGLTTMVVPCTLSSLRQATFLEIPASRRNFTIERAKELGYGA